MSLLGIGPKSADTQTAHRGQIMAPQAVAVRVACSYATGREHSQHGTESAVLGVELLIVISVAISEVLGTTGHVTGSAMEQAPVRTWPGCCGRRPRT